MVLLILIRSASFAQTVNDSLRTSAETFFRLWQIAKTDELTALINPDLKQNQKQQITSSFFTTIQAVKVLGNIASAKALNYIGTKQQKSYKVYIPFMLNNKIYTLSTDFINKNGKFHINGPVQFINGIIEKKASQGMALFKAKCFSCHGLYGEGTIGPNLTDAWWKYAHTDEEVFNVIKNGKKGTIMIAFGNYLKDDELKEIILYLGLLQGQTIKKGKPKEGTNHKVLLKDLYLKRN